MLTHGVVHTAIVTILIVLTYFATFVRAGAARGKHHIIAPATTGHPEFERAYRVQMNTLEQLAMALPLLWLATLYPFYVPSLPALIGVVWVIGRILYMQAYIKDPAKRAPGFIIGGLCLVAWLVLAIGGIILAWPNIHQP